ncbi:MAG: hypothetical protein ACE5EL_07480, partial [Anaerolineae bacterium]
MTIPLNYKVCRALASYLRVRPEVGYDSLFLNKYRRPSPGEPCSGWWPSIWPRPGSKGPQSTP